MVEWDELRALIKDRMEAQDVINLLDLEVDDVLDAFSEEIMDKLPDFLEELDIEATEEDVTDE